MKTLKIWIWIFASVMIIMILLYFIQFSGRLSDDNADWGTFGDYLSGIFAVFNLGVVVLLTLYVSHKEDLRDKLAKDEQEIRNQKDLEFQRERSERELGVQRKILLSNARFDELNRYISDLQEVRKFKTEMEPDHMLIITSDLINLNSQFSTNNPLFPIFEEERFKSHFKKIDELLHRIADEAYSDNVLMFHQSIQRFLGYVRLVKASVAYYISSDL